MVRLRKQPRSWTIKECYAEDNAPKVSDLDWIPKNSALFLEELLMEKKKSSRDAFTKCCCISPYCIQSLYLKGSWVGNTFLKECFISPWAASKDLYLAQRLHCNSLHAYGGLWWGAATFALQFNYHYNQSSQMFQIAKWDLSHCDQCSLSKDMNGMNVVVDEHLVTF